MQNTRKLVILTGTEAIEIHETLSGSFAITGPDGARLANSNFFTLDGAARAGLELALRAIGEAEGCDSDARGPLVDEDALV